MDSLLVRKGVKYFEARISGEDPDNGTLQGGNRSIRATSEKSDGDDLGHRDESASKGNDIAACAWSVTSGDY